MRGACEKVCPLEMDTETEHFAPFATLLFFCVARQKRQIRRTSSRVCLRRHLINSLVVVGVVVVLQLFVRLAGRISRCGSLTPRARARQMRAAGTLTDERRRRRHRIASHRKVIYSRLFARVAD